MEEEKLGKLLNELADTTAEPADPDLAEDIKNHIPRRLGPHRGGIDTIKIMIDLRVSKVAAAAAIIITTLLFATFLGGRGSTGDSIYQDSKLLIEYCLVGDGIARSDVLAGGAKFYEYLVRQGRDAAYYGHSIDPDDKDAVLIQWKLDKGRYRVIFGDLRTKTVTAEELIKLQARMLQKKTK